MKCSRVAAIFSVRAWSNGGLRASPAFRCRGAGNETQQCSNVRVPVAHHLDISPAFCLSVPWRCGAALSDLRKVEYPTYQGDFKVDVTRSASSNALLPTSLHTSKCRRVPFAHPPRCLAMLVMNKTYYLNQLHVCLSYRRIVGCSCRNGALASQASEVGLHSYEESWRSGGDGQS